MTGASRGWAMPITAAATSGQEHQEPDIVAEPGRRADAGPAPEHTITRLPAAASATHQGTIAVSERSALAAIASMVAQNTASTGEKPSSMKAMIEISEPK